MDIILAVAVTLLALCVIILQSRNSQLSHRVVAEKALHTSALREAREWERKYWAAHTEDTPNTPEGALAPPSHGVDPIDPETVMAGSDDPVWDIVIACRTAGVMKDWLFRHPEIRAQQPHRWYGEFATFILQLPENERTVDGVAKAVRNDSGVHRG